MYSLKAKHYCLTFFREILNIIIKEDRAVNIGRFEFAYVSRRHLTLFYLTVPVSFYDRRPMSTGAGLFGRLRRKPDSVHHADGPTVYPACQL